MCLQTVDTKPRRKKGTGYKVVINDNGVLRPEFGYLERYKVNRWMTDPNPISQDFFDYPVGFHILTSLRAAKRWASYGLDISRFEVRKVEFKNVVATGTQYVSGLPIPANVVVARRIFIGGKVNM